MKILLSFFIVFTTTLTISNAWGVTNLQTCFSPDEKCDKVIIEYIGSAKKSIDMAIYSLSLDDIREALIAAKQKGIKIRIVSDLSQSENENSLVPTIIKDGFDLRFGSQKGVMHNKFTIVDGVWLETGSYNYSFYASRMNAENQIYMNDPTVLASYQKEFESIWGTGTTPAVK